STQPSLPLPNSIMMATILYKFQIAIKTRLPWYVLWVKDAPMAVLDSCPGHCRVVELAWFRIDYL
ncbi:MAG: hypothetical protein BZY75_01695, partial [SAR202 cluster bacterium Io17-Chloro-G7]